MSMADCDLCDLRFLLRAPCCKAVLASERARV